ncbi:MAG: high-potential iron-sulfur protein [Gammaproteobacteria bacterium]
MTNDKVSRRRFLKIGAASTIAVPLVAGTLPVRAQDAVALTEDDATAQALGYKIDATTVDTAKFATYKDGQNCGNCLQYQGKDGAASGLCAIFPGKQVAGSGWCQVWVKGA